MNRWTANVGQPQDQRPRSRSERRLTAPIGTAACPAGTVPVEIRKVHPYAQPSFATRRGTLHAAPAKPAVLRAADGAGSAEFVDLTGGIMS